ncbi:MAG: LacI family DNA-binding transcriptional regulator [Microbacteriaceae bacterium]|nr:LacI family DNA-binding transcriptional regulator [Microbacteriaceae bacterium]MCL2795526.1 LacI family DNA-binding transcriptional regulator [Microbacteriaceae bacterium]
MSKSSSTLSHIARDAEVSPSTVSKVLNGRAGVAPQTRERVERALRSHGYSPPGERHLQPFVELVFERVESAFAIEIIRGVQRAAASRSMSVVLSETGTRHRPGPEWIDQVVQRRPSGVVLVFSDLPAESKARLALRGIPFVVLDPAGDPAPDVPSVGSANWSGGVLAARHLLELGHTRIAVIGGPQDMMCSRARVAGFRAAFEDAALPFDESLLVWGDFLRGDGVQLGRDLLMRDDRPTAIFAGNDLMALGVLEAARTLGLSVPGDVSVVGYDDLQIARWSGPPLTTVRQPLAEMGEQAALLALDAADAARPLRAARVDLATSLVVRESTGAPRVS